MERLKKLLRQAIQEQAQRLKLQDGQVVEVQTTAGAKPMAGEGAVDADYVQKLYAFLFPHDKAQLTARQPTKGALNVPNVGKILLIAQPASPVSLRLYLPPQGPALFESDWARLNSKTVAPGEVNTVPPMAVGIPMPPPPRMVPSAPVPTPPAPAPEAGGGFVPLKFATDFDMPVVASAPSPAVIPPMAVALEDMDPGLGFQPPIGMVPDLAADLGGMPDVNDIVIQAPQIQAPARPARPMRAAAPAPIMVEQAADVVTELPEISFTAEAPGSMSTSDGQNPIDSVLIEMVSRKASDLHMTTSEPYCYRIDGEIQRITSEPVTSEQMQKYLMPILPRRNHEEFVKGNDTDFAYEIRGVGRFRVNIFRDRNGVGTVMRHIPSKILTAEQLNLPPAITKFCQLTKGLVVVTGPTGSGKSTTLAAMIDLINKSRHDHILTIEDPIEFVHPQQKCLVNQREVHKHTTSFSRALRAALREDPDIVLIGEMRDLETIAIAIETAETGHLVFGTLHTTTAVSTIDRIVDQFPTTQQEQIRTMLSSSLRGVVAQTLLKKKGGGRIAAHEILVTVDAVSAMIREGKNHMIPNHMQSQRADGNILLNESLLRLVKENVVDADDAMRKAVDKASLVELFKRNSIKFTEITMAPPAKTPTKQSA